jgi:GNAT superfamily N-acetyltransferase
MTPAPPDIRAATSADAEALAPLFARALRETYAADSDPAELAEHIARSCSVQAWVAKLTDPRGLTLIADAAGTPVGFASLRFGSPTACVPDPAPAELAQIYLVREAIGRGIGSALMRSCIDEARRRGHGTMWLSVWDRNVRASRFYERWGFRHAGTHPFVFGTRSYDDLVMTRALPEEGAT